MCDKESLRAFSHAPLRLLGHFPPPPPPPSMLACSNTNQFTQHSRGGCGESMRSKVSQITVVVLQVVFLQMILSNLISKQNKILRQKVLKNNNQTQDKYNIGMKGVLWSSQRKAKLVVIVVVVALYRIDRIFTQLVTQCVTTLIPAVFQTGNLADNSRFIGFPFFDILSLEPVNFVSRWVVDKEMMGLL